MLRLGFYQIGEIMDKRFLINNKMPIGAYHGPMCETGTWKGYPNHIVNKSYELAKDGGFNFMVSFAERFPACREKVFEALNYADKNGIKMMLSDENIEQGTIEHLTDVNGEYPDVKGMYESSIAEYGKHPAFFGCYILDEPFPDRFPLTAKLRQTFDEVTPDKLFFVNMLPMYGISGLKHVYWIFDNKERAQTYDDYVCEYLSKVNPPLFCYDLYPFQQDFPTISGDFFPNLQIVARRCKEKNIPFWVSPQAYASLNSENTGIRQCSQAEMMFQISAYLCYGAKGFVYYCWERYTDSFQMALIERETNEPTPLYYLAKRANAWIDKVSDYLIDAENLGVIKVGSTPAFIEETEKDCIGGITQVKGKHLLVGYFSDKGKERYYIFNNGITEPDFASVKLPENKTFIAMDENIKSQASGEWSGMIEPGCSVLLIEK